MRIELSPMVPAFLGSVQAFASDPVIGAASNVPHPYPSDGAIRWYERISALMDSGRSDVCAILVDGAFGGVISLNSIDRDAGEAAIDYWVAVPLQGRGVAKQAVRLCIRRAEVAFFVRTLHSNCLAENIASAAVLLHNDFVETKGRLLEHGKFAGRQMRTFKRLTRMSGPQMRR